MENRKIFFYDSVRSNFSVIFSNIFGVNLLLFPSKNFDAIISPGLNVKRFLPSQNLVQSYTYFFTVQRI